MVLLIYCILILYTCVVVFPMAWLLYTSLKTDRDIFLDPFSLPDLGNLQWMNFTNAWTKGHFGDYFFNSIVLTLTTVTLSVFVAAMAAYALSRFRFPGARPLFFYFLAGLMIPLQLAIVPLFFQMKQIGLLNSRIGLLVAYVAFGMPFAIFILTGFFKSLPSSLHESALIDGCGELRRLLVGDAAPGAAGTDHGGDLFVPRNVERVLHGLHVSVRRGLRGAAHTASGAGQHHHRQSVPLRLGHGLRRPGADDDAYAAGLFGAAAAPDEGHHRRCSEGLT
jgi:hypothetical protein